MEVVLDPEQQAVMSFNGGMALVQGKAGTGKTETLCQKAAKALADGVAPEDILCLLRNDWASQSVRRRINELAGDKAARIFCGTKVQLCQKVLADADFGDPSLAVMSDTDYQFLSKIESKSVFDHYREHETAVTYAFEYYLHQSDYRSDFYENLVRRETNRDKCKEDCDEAQMRMGLTDRARVMSRAYDLFHGKRNTDTKRHPEKVHCYKLIMMDDFATIDPITFALLKKLCAEGGTTIYFGEPFTNTYSEDRTYVTADFPGPQRRIEEKEYNKNQFELKTNHRQSADFAHRLQRMQVLTGPNYFEFLPWDKRHTKPDPPTDDAFTAIISRSSEHMKILAVNCARRLAQRGTVALLVSDDSHSKSISEKLFRHGLSHHAVRTGLVGWSECYRTLLNHIAICADDMNWDNWMPLLDDLRIIWPGYKIEETRKCLKDNSMRPADLLRRDNSTYVLALKTYLKGTVVAFSVATTEPNPYHSKVTRIAARKLKVGGANGAPDTFEVEVNDKNFRNTIRAFVEFADNAPLVCVNADFNARALLCDIQTRTQRFKHDIVYLRGFGAELQNDNKSNKQQPVFDAAIAARLMLPNCKSVSAERTLRDLLEKAETPYSKKSDISPLESGTVSHALAVAELATALKVTEIDKTKKTYEFDSVRKDLQQRYARYFCALQKQLAEQRPGKTTLADVMREYHQKFSGNGFAPCDAGAEILFKCVEETIIDSATAPYLSEQCELYLEDVRRLQLTDVFAEQAREEPIHVVPYNKMSGREYDSVVLCHASFSTQDRRNEQSVIYEALAKAKSHIEIIGMSIDKYIHLEYMFKMIQDAQHDILVKMEEMFDQKKKKQTKKS